MIASVPHDASDDVMRTWRAWMTISHRATRSRAALTCASVSVFMAPLPGKDLTLRSGTRSSACELKSKALSSNPPTGRSFSSPYPYPSSCGCGAAARSARSFSSRMARMMSVPGPRCPWPSTARPAWGVGASSSSKSSSYCSSSSVSSSSSSKSSSYCEGCGSGSGYRSWEFKSSEFRCRSLKKCATRGGGSRVRARTSRFSPPRSRHP